MTNEELLARYISPHTKPSRPVTEADLDRVVDEAIIMAKLCRLPRGKNKSAYAIAHAQIHEDPLAFFVLKEGVVIINPVITRHTQAKVMRKEGCFSFPDREWITVERYNKCEVEFQTIGEDGKLTEVLHDQLNGVYAEIFQHEVDHLAGRNIYL